jgi:DNA helicase-2/ATP-dependent DNA helicase PcrA
MSLTTRNELEEERRLFYVALTRAEKKATLSYATSRYRWGSLISCEPSRFLEEIDEEFIDIETPIPTAPARTSSDRKAGFEMKFNKPLEQKQLSQMKKVTTASAPGGGSDSKEIVVGVNVRHAKFGKGKIINIEGTYPNRKATAFFPSVGQKQLLLKFAKLEIID